MLIFIMKFKVTEAEIAGYFFNNTNWNESSCFQRSTTYQD